jgi:hypothetical protein
LGVLTLLFAPISFSQSGSQSGDDPFAFFRPSVDITPSERAQLDEGQPFSRVIPSKGHEVAVLAAIPVKIDGDRLLAWHRQIEELKKNPHEIAIGRFSNPPRIEDLAGLELDSGDIAAIRSCRPRDCELKLSAAEMEQLKKVEAQAKGDKEAAVQQAFRHLVLNRVQQYLANGYIPPDEDHHEQVQPASRFAALLDHTPFLENRLPQLAKGLRYPQNEDPGVESILYWSKEHIARKPVISVTHLSVVRGDSPGLPDTLIVGRDVFSTHYVDASLSVMALMRGDTSTRNYLIYINRTDVDVLHGVFAGVIRRSIQSRLKAASDMMTDLRQRLESGDPPKEPAPSARR